jgi:hypothetical protein
MWFDTGRVSKVYFGIFLVLSMCSTAFGQANVNESLESAFIYVNGSAGTDANSGSQSAPLQTIGAALAKATTNNHKNIGSAVIIAPGIYRESLSLGNGRGSTSMPITIEAATNGTVFVSGADAWTGWSAYAPNHQIYTAAWPYQWGSCPTNPDDPTQQEIVLRREIVAVNGTAMTEVLSLAAMQPGTFFPDEANATLYVWPPAGTNMATADVEVATRQNLFSDYGQPDVVLRGLTFEYANNCRQTAAVDFDNQSANNVLIDSDAFRWNNGIGLSLTGPQNFTVQFSRANHNGQMGFFTSEVKSGLWTSDLAAHNNWRGGQGAYYTWDTGGGKFMRDHDSTFENFTAKFNYTHAMHFDTDNANFSISSLVAVGNVNGLLIEKSEGPATISNSYFCGNTPLGQNYEGGISMLDSTYLTYTGNALYSNGSNQVNLVGDEGGFDVTNWETGQVYHLYTDHVTLQGNAIVGGATAQVFRTYLGGTDWTEFVSTLNSNNNTWWAGSNTSAFTVPSPKYENIDLSGWQGLTGQDTNSTWASVASPAKCNVAAAEVDYPDFLFITNTINPETAATGNASYTLATVALKGMTGTVNLSADGLSAIPGAAASFSPSSISTNGQSTMTVTVTGDTPAGTYPIVAIANSGNITHTITFSLVVP